MASLQRPDLGTPLPLGVPQVITDLHPQPRLRGSAKRGPQPNRHVCIDGGLAIDHARQPARETRRCVAKPFTGDVAILAENPCSRRISPGCGGLCIRDPRPVGRGVHFQTFHFLQVIQNYEDSSSACVAVVSRNTRMRRFAGDPTVLPSESKPIVPMM